MLENPSDPFKDDRRHLSAGIRDSCPCILYNRIGPAGRKLPNKAELTGTSAPVRQILLCIEELQTFNMVSGIDLRHLGLKPLYSPASVSPLTPEKAPPSSQQHVFDQTVQRLPVANFS